MYLLLMGKHKNKKPLKIADPQFSDPLVGPIGFEARHHKAAELARDNPGQWIAVYATTQGGAYTAISLYRSGKRRPRAYDDIAFEFLAIPARKAPLMREVCVRYNPTLSHLATKKGKDND